MKRFKLFRNKPKNWLLKLISLTLAIMLWYFVVGEDQVDINIQVPVEIINLPANLTISNQYKKDIEVAVRGPRSMIQELRNRNITRPVDLANAQPGTVVIKNDENSIPLPRGITIQRLQPTNITLLLDELLQKRFPITPVTEGEPASGYTLHKIYLDPDHLTISGPRSILEESDELNTYVIDISNLNRSTTLQVHLNLEPDFFDLIGETVVSARIEVHEKMTEQTVTNIPINVRDASSPVLVEPDTVSVRARIPENLVKDTPEPAMLFRASVSSRDVGDDGKMPVTVNGVNVPGHEPITILSMTPDHVIVSPVENGKPQPDKTRQ
ncbi:MAG: CdaR family protein [Desulfobulbaceae bacterium]|nr:CdaR family protein [Desulfobulbaceae bacterium]